MILGLDLLGLGSKHWDIAMTAKEFPAGWALGCFDGTTGNAKFGDAIPGARKILETGKVALFRVHISYRKDHRVAPIPDLERRLPKWNALAKAFPGVPFYVSHSCEYQEGSLNEIQRRVSLIKKLAPACIPVNSMMQGPTIPGVITEHHAAVDERNRRTGYKSPRCKAGQFASSDGISASQMNIEHFLKLQAKAAVVFLWASRFNLREVVDKGQALPEPEARSAVPNAKYLRAVVALGKQYGVAPSPQFKGAIRPVSDPVVWKLMAEDKAGPDPTARENRPCFISPCRSESLSIVACNGKEVAKLRLFGGFGPGMYRHYSGTATGLYGHEIAARAKRLSGSEFVWITEDRKTYYGVLNPAHRIGYY